VLYRATSGIAGTLVEIPVVLFILGGRRVFNNLCSRFGNLCRYQCLYFNLAVPTNVKVGTPSTSTNRQSDAIVKALLRTFAETLYAMVFLNLL